MHDSRDYVQKLALQMTPAMRYNGTESFESWKARAREKLAELLGFPFAVCEDAMTITAKKEFDTYERVDFTFQSEEGYFVPCSILIPDGEPKPIAICVQGHSSGMHISFGEEKFEGDAALIAGGRDFAVRALEEGYCAVVLEQRYMGMCGSFRDGAPLCARRNAALPALLLGRTAIGERVWDIIRLMDVLQKYFSDSANTEKILCMGNSGGGTSAFYASCMDDRIQLAMPSCAVCEFEDSIIPLHHCGCNYIPHIRKYFEMGDLAGLIADRTLVMVCGVHDPDFPLAGVIKSYERARKLFRICGREDRCILVQGPQGHQFYPDLAWPIANGLFYEI